MKKLIVFTLFILFSFFISYNPTIQALDVTAKSGSPQDIQAAVNQVNAAGGGTVFIPAGTFQWNGETVNIPGGVNVFGASYAGCKGHEDNWEHYTATTVLHNDAAQPFPDMFVVLGANGKQTRISGIQFEANDPSSEPGASLNSAISVREAKDFRIDHCTILNFTGTSIVVAAGTDLWEGEVGHSSYGVIDHCFIDVPYKDNGGVWLWGYGISAMGNMQPKLNNWNPNTRYYAGKYQAFTDVALVYIEDCNFRRTRHAVDGNGGAMMVTRYCLLDHIADEGNALYSNYELDAHPWWNNSQYPPVLAEAYYNKFVNDGHLSCPVHPGQIHSQIAMCLRGGSGLFFGNEYLAQYPAPNWAATLVYLSDESENPPNGIINETYIWDEDGRYVNVWPSDADNDGIVDGFITRHGNPAPQLNVNFFLRKPNLAQDGRTYTPYPYPHPLTIESSNLKIISGRLIDKSNNPVAAKIIIYLAGTSSNVNSTQTNSTGYYSLQVPSGNYDIQFNFSSIPNYYIKLLSVKLSTDRANILNYINYSSQRLSFNVDFNGSQGIETYSPSRPSRVLKNGSVISNVSSLSNLINNSWYFDSPGKKLNILVDKSTMIEMLRCSGTKIINTAGQEVILQGVGRMGFEYYDSGYRETASEYFDQDADKVKSWNSNWIRIPFNANLYKTDASYRAVLKDLVQKHANRGIYSLMDLHWWRDGQLPDNIYDNDAQVVSYQGESWTVAQWDENIIQVLEQMARDYLYEPYMIGFEANEYWALKDRSAGWIRNIKFAQNLSVRIHKINPYLLIFLDTGQNDAAPDSVKQSAVQYLTEPNVVLAIHTYNAGDYLPWYSGVKGGGTWPNADCDGFGWWERYDPTSPNFNLTQGKAMYYRWADYYYKPMQSYFNRPMVVTEWGVYSAWSGDQSCSDMLSYFNARGWGQNYWAYYGNSNPEGMELFYAPVYGEWNTLRPQGVSLVNHMTGT